MARDGFIRTAPLGGVGTIWWPEIDELFTERGLIDVAEIEPTTFWRRSAGGGYCWPREVVARLASLPQEKLLHGTGFPVGDAMVAAADYGAAMTEWVAALSAPWTSEHLSVQEDDEGGSLGFLMPPPQTDVWVERAAAHVAQRQMLLGRPFAFETGVNYFRPQKNEMRDGAFFAEVARRADCGVLLDLHNIWANARNGRQSVDALLADLPLERVWELHVAGGLSHNGYWLDAHHGATPEAVLAIARELAPHLPNLGAIIYEINPPTLAEFGLRALRAELERLRLVWELRSSRCWIAPRAGGSSPDLAVVRDVAYTQELVRGLVAARRGVRTGERDPAFALYAELIRAGRLGVLTELLPDAVTTLLKTKGVEQAENLLDAYLDAVRPRLFGVEEASAFADWLQREDPALAQTLARAMRSPPDAPMLADAAPRRQ